MGTTKDYHASLIGKLADSQEAAAYLNAALEEGEPKLFLTALRNVAEAKGGLKQLAVTTKLNRRALYRTLSEEGNPELSSLNVVLHAFGLRLAVEAERRPSHQKAKRPRAA